MEYQLSSCIQGSQGIPDECPCSRLPTIWGWICTGGADASGVGLGAVLAHKQDDGITQPNAYASRTLQSHERNYGVTELEALGVVWAVRHFRHYLYGTRCNVFTDHEALKTLLNTPHPSGKLARWGLSLQELDVHIH